MIHIKRKVSYILHIAQSGNGVQLCVKGPI